ncbi:putative GPI-anchored protein 7 [Candida viswanathii]|uniref:Putative GPI-anchored protein 7 n=1 Tax=Candida viswanathii TaxID=5486 RepID=A0A367Y0G6_9ASCO|nr:putative GPI-anchored protein 7 [Candida viswanathii]RCK59363.1 putative GPI-anchored protein 7 [Candida viswanathii]
MNFFLILFFIQSILADDWATYPKIPKTASINGFADPIYDLMPTCAQSCLKFSTSNTPCPYWDTGCFCVMPQWSGLVGQCIAQNCQGDDVASATFLATSLCSLVGANTWMMPASISSQLSTAAGNAREVTTIEGKTAMSWVTAPGSSVAGDEASETGSSSSAASSDSSSSASETGSSSSANIGVLQTGGVGTMILGVLMYLVV